MPFEILLALGGCVLSLFVSVLFAALGVILGKALANGPDFKDPAGLILAFVFASSVVAAVVGGILALTLPDVIGIWIARAAVFAAFVAIGLVVKDKKESD